MFVVFFFTVSPSYKNKDCDLLISSFFSINKLCIKRSCVVFCILQYQQVMCSKILCSFLYSSVSRSYMYKDLLIYFFVFQYQQAICKKILSWYIFFLFFIINKWYVWRSCLVVIFVVQYQKVIRIKCLVLFFLSSVWTIGTHKVSCLISYIIQNQQVMCIKCLILLSMFFSINNLYVQSV